MKKDYRAMVLDMDGVLVDFNSAFAKKIHAIFPEFKVPGDIKNPKTWHWPAASGVPSEVEDSVWEIIKEDKVFWPNLECLIDKKTIEDIYNFSLVVPTYVATSRPDGYSYSIVDATVKSLENIGLSSLGVVCSNQKELLVKPLGIRFFLDDKFKNVRDVAKEVELQGVEDSVIAILNMKYNEHEKLPENVIRVESVDEFLEVVYQTLCKEVKDDGDKEASEGNENTDGDSDS